MFGKLPLNIILLVIFVDNTLWLLFIKFLSSPILVLSFDYLRHGDVLILFVFCRLLVFALSSSLNASKDPRSRHVYTCVLFASDLAKGHRQREKKNDGVDGMSFVALLRFIVVDQLDVLRVRVLLQMKFRSASFSLDVGCSKIV